MNRDAAELSELRKRQATSNVSVPELTTELKSVKTRLVQGTAKNLELCTKLGTVVTESDKSLEELAVVRGAVTLSRDWYDLFLISASGRRCVLQSSGSSADGLFPYLSGLRR